MLQPLYIFFWRYKKMDKVIVHDAFENEVVSRAMDTYYNKELLDRDNMEAFANDISEMPKELVEKIFTRLYEEGVVKDMTRIMREEMEAYANNE